VCPPRIGGRLDSIVRGRHLPVVPRGPYGGTPRVLFRLPVPPWQAAACLLTRRPVNRPAVHDHSTGRLLLFSGVWRDPSDVLKPIGTTRG